MQPAEGGGSCQAGNVGVIVQGSLKGVHDDGNEIEVSAGDPCYFSRCCDNSQFGFRFWYFFRAMFTFLLFVRTLLPFKPH